jgi:tellurite resistance protein TerC
MLALDLGVFHRQAHAVGWREALGWSIFWITLALVFNLGIYLYAGAQPALEFLAGYLIEKSLSVDNIFVFLVIFSYFAVPAAYQHRVLFYGILGALIMRAVFILLGAAMLEAFHWTIYVFGAILLITAVKLLVHRHEDVHPERNPVVRLFKRFVPLVTEYRGPRFLVSEAGRWRATPLLLVLVTIEATDVVFAVDSIPAIFAVTRDPFIVYTSNIFAILGLRALFFLLAGAIGKLYYLKTGLAIVLGFVGVKMVIADWYKIPITVSLAIIAACIGGAALASLLRSPPPVALASEKARDRDFAAREIV